jgi:hypothetical protein
MLFGLGGSGLLRREISPQGTGQGADYEQSCPPACTNIFHVSMTLEDWETQPTLQ